MQYTIECSEEHFNKITIFLTHLKNECFKNKPTLPIITEAVCGVYGRTADEIMVKSRVELFREPRQVIMYLAHKNKVTTFASIGKYFGGKHHATVIHAVKKIVRMQFRNAPFVAKLDEIESIIKSKCL